MGEAKRRQTLETAATLAPDQPLAAAPGQRYPMIGIPLYSGKIDVPLFHSLAAASSECMARGWQPPYVMFRTLDSVITRARNVTVAHFLTRTPCTDLVFVDGDIAWDPGSFARLLDHPVDLVAGVYPARGEPERYIVRPLENELVVDQATGLMEVAGVGTGFMRMTRACAQRMTDVNADRWYLDDATAPGLKIHALFDFELVPNGPDALADGSTYFSEDYTFCRRWRALGEKVWIDPQLTLHHTGEKTFSGKFISFLNRQYLAHNPPAAKSTLDLVKGLLEQTGASVEISERPRNPEPDLEIEEAC